MNENLDKILTGIAEDFHANISGKSKYYLEVDIGRQAEKLGYTDEKEKYGRAFAVVPLKEPLRGLKVMIDGRTFKDYAQFASGIAVPAYVARESRQPYKPYRPADSLVLNFA
ncbi:MAG: hypothetical protein V2I97_12795 [Desulfococcaceae bacterium]|nr:hypothetical protein [Desulfococcaceae bacterium]